MFDEVSVIGKSESEASHELQLFAPLAVLMPYQMITLTALRERGLS